MEVSNDRFTNRRCLSLHRPAVVQTAQHQLEPQTHLLQGMSLSQERERYAYSVSPDMEEIELKRIEPQTTILHKRCVYLMCCIASTNTIYYVDVM